MNKEGDKMKRIAINGFGRVGRIVFKELLDAGLEVVAINDLCDNAQLAYLLKYDSVHGRYDRKVDFDDKNLIVGNKKIQVLSEADAKNLPWGQLKIDLVVECTGFYTNLDNALDHVRAGAKHVIISAPGKGDMKTIVYGVNDKILDGKELVFSSSSCTTNCLAPLLKVIDDNYTIKEGFISTIHAYTNDQKILDVSHKKAYTERRGRASAINIIPTTTGAASSIGNVLPSLKGKLKGIAFRVPVSDGSLIDATITIEEKTTIDKINELYKKNENEVLNITFDPIVSSDIIGESCATLIDGSLTDVIENQIKIVAWYDNEFGYSMQMVRTIKKFLELTD